MAATSVLGALVLSSVVATAALAAGPPYPTRDPARSVRDDAGVLDGSAIDAIDESILRLRDELRIDAVVYLQEKPASDTFEEALADARSLADSWAVGAGARVDGLVVLLDLDSTRCHGQFQMYADEEMRRRVDDAARQQIFESEVLPLLKECEIGAAIRAGLDAIETRLTGIAAEPSGDVVEPSFPPETTGAGGLVPPVDDPPGDQPPVVPDEPAVAITDPGAAPSTSPDADSAFGGTLPLVVIAGLIIAAVSAVGIGFKAGSGRTFGRQTAIWPSSLSDGRHRQWHLGPFGGHVESSTDAGRRAVGSGTSGSSTSGGSDGSLGDGGSGSSSSGGSRGAGGGF